MWTRRTARVCVSIVSVVVLATGVASPAVAAPAGTSAWRDHTATDTGPYTAPQMAVTLALGWRNAGALKTLLAAPHAPLSPGEFNARFAPSAATVSAIGSWAQAHQLTVSSVSANRALIKLSGSSAQIAHALGTSFDTFDSAITAASSRPPRPRSCRRRSPRR